MDKKFIYFFINYPRNQIEKSGDIIFKQLDQKNAKYEWVFSRPTYDNDGDKKYINYKKVFKIEAGKTNNAKYFFQFELDDDKYIISFDSQGKTFIYDISLEVGKRILPIKTNIDQDLIEYNEKIDYFMEAIESNEDKDKKESIKNALLKDSIELYKKKKGFDFLISLFLKVYKNEELCNSLLKIFREMNEKSTGEKNKEIKEFLKEYTSKFESIAYEAEEVIKNNKYNAVDFYGIILCYLNNYNLRKFSEIFNALSDKKPEELYNILLIYNTNFINPIKQNSDFFNKFIKYTLEKQNYSKYQIALNYIKDIKIFLEVIDANKEEIYNKYIASDNDPKKNEKYYKYIIKMDNNYKLKNDENFEKKEIISQQINEQDNKIESDYLEKKEIPSIIDNINSILRFSEEKSVFLIYFTSSFWGYILNFCKKPILDNILNCSNLRNAFFKYYSLVKKLIPKKIDKMKINNDSNNLFEIDEFANLLDQIIKKYINNNREIKDIEKLSFLTTYHPYYKKEKGEKYSNKAETDILDLFDLDKINEKFIGFFRDMNFEIIFESNIHEYISKLTSKIKNISNFENIIKLINFKSIELKNIILNSLNDYFNKLIMKNISTLSGEKLNEAVKVTAIISIVNFLYEQQKDKKLEFTKDVIKKSDEKLKPLIMTEIIEICVNKKFQNQLYLDADISDINNIKDFIFEQFSSKVKTYVDIKNIINLIKCIEKTAEENQKSEIINQVLNKLIEKNLFTKEEFFKNKPNPKIKLLYELNKEGIIQKNDEDYYDKIQKLIISINSDINDLNIKKKELTDFLKINKSFILERLSLIKIISDNSASADEKLSQLIKKNEEINKDFEKFKFIYNNIRIYYKTDYKDIINKLFKIINDTENKEISHYKGGGTISDLMKECDRASLYTKAERIKNVQDFLLFKVLYEMNPGINDESSFKLAYDKYEKIREFLKGNSDNTDINKLYEENKESFDKIREYLSIDEDEAEKFIDKLKQHFGIDNEKLIDDLNILFKSKKYELEINSIIYFFQFFEKDNPDWNSKIPETYKDLSEKDFTNIKSILLTLKNHKIYDYKNKNNYYCQLFKCLYEQKEAIDFLFEKINQNKQNINSLKNKIPPTSKTINEDDITSTQECIFHFNKMKNKKNNFERLDYVKSLTEKEIKNFENYSKIFNSVIELDRSDEFSDDVYEQVNSKIEQELILNILQDSEDFMYYSKSKGQYEKLTLKQLLDLKNKIPNENIKDTNKENEQNDLKDKRKTLFFFKDLINDLEIINKYMKVLREKGCSLPIKICIKVNKNERNYYLEDKEVKIDFIKEFLLKVKNMYIPQLNSMYKLNANLRFLYGKQFNSMMKHIQKSYNLDSFLRYILNIKENDIIIKEGDKGLGSQVKDYISLPEKYSENSFKAISEYITDLFKKNNKPMEKHYNNIKITPIDIFKGIYLQKCNKENPMEKFIINLFWEKLTELPIAQNVLITSKETSIEEIQSFLHRAILCNYNTLFVVEINDSFSEYQQNIMNSYIDQLLTHKNNKYNEIQNDKIDKKYTQKYMDSCLVFIYDEDNKKITSFLKEINKCDEQKFEFDSKNNIIDTNKEKILLQLGNIKVITSDICGLGKSGKIKKEIQKSSKKCFHFPLGGILSKDIIFKKLENLLRKIQNYNYKDVAIHLDLTESKEKSIINEFLFSFLITKFYSNNENIIYIPNNIDIYVEIPNCFEDYLSKFNILNIFKQDNITFTTMPEFDYPKEIIDIFNRILNYNSNDDIKKFVKDYIGIEKYSYHQINIFIKIFLSQFYSLGNFKITNKSGDNITKDFVKKFTPCTKYFTNGGFAQLLTNDDNKKNDKEDYIDKLSNSFEDDVHKDFKTPFYFINKDNDKYDLKKYTPFIQANVYKNSKYYLKKIKEYFLLPNEVEKDVGDKKSLLSIIEEKDNNYVITNDNFNKMILLVYRIKANVPVIIMGDTGCGKTALITKLNQLLNNGEKTIQTINIHPGINDDELCKIMKEKDEIAKKQLDKEVWLFFDEINTCLSLSLLTEIFINRTYNGNSISDNIRLIGACNPYRRKKANKEKCGLSLKDDNKKELVYLVEQLPQSLLYYVFSFGSINEDDEKRYIHSIIENLFSEEEKDLHEATTEAISKCHIYLRNTFDSSVVSLREITRFAKCVVFFMNYFTKKNNNYFIKKNVCEKRINNERNNKIRSIICSIYLCYYIRLVDEKKRTNFDVDLRKSIFKLVNTKEESLKLNEYKNIMKKLIDGKLDEKNITEDEKKIIDDIIAIELTEEEKSLIDYNDDEKNKENNENNENNENKNKIDRKKLEKIELNEKELELVTQNLNKSFDKEELIEKEKNKIIHLLKEIKIKYIKYYEGMDEKKGTIEQFKNKDFKNEIQSRPNEIIDQFSDFIKIEQNYLIEQVELDRGIGKNTLLKENLFLLFVSVNTNIPLIIIGKPGSGKSLSAQLIYKSMKGEYSKNKFFKLFPRIIQTYFQGSKTTDPKDVETLFTKAGKKLNYYKKKREEDQNKTLPISMILFDELGLAELSETNPLKVLHSKLEYGGKEEGVSFVGISNYTLDAAKINRALVLSVPDLDQKLDEIISTAKNIVESISPNIKDDNIFEILSNTYFEYKNYLQLIKELMVYKIYKNSSSNENKDKDGGTVTSETNEQIDNNIDEVEQGEKKNKREKRQFSDIKQDDKFKELMKSETKIRKDFHGNRDFYHIIKGIAYDFGKTIDLEDSNNEKIRIIIKYIERNFGGIDYEIDIDFNLTLDDIQTQIDSIHDIFKAYNEYREGKIVKLRSIYLFKALYNMQCDKIEQNCPLKIDTDIINDYNLNKSINDNIQDNNSRYLLLEVKQSLNTLIFQNIRLQNENTIKDEIELYDGSPFVDDTNNEYRFKKINEIQEDAKKDKLIIIENLNQIHPFLFDLYNRNFQIINGKKFARICLDNFDEQLTEVNNGFRIIILVDKRFVNKCDLAFLNRLEKHVLSFDQLLDNRLKKISRSLISDIKLRNTISLYENSNYSLKNLLINCGDEEIQGLIYYFSTDTKKEGKDVDNEKLKEENISESTIRENVINKIYKILPQDIIAILPEDNIVRKKYFEMKNINNFNDYIEGGEYKKYKISIIYTYTTSVDGLTSGMSFLISEIKSENDFKTKIAEIKKYSNNREDQYICIHFDQSNSKNIKFISNLLTKFKDDYKYIIIIHINRNFNKNINDKIYSVPDINPDINQLFIDNLNDNNTIKLKDILQNGLQNLLKEKRYELNLDDEFNKTLKNFLKKELNAKDVIIEDKKDYIDHIIDYMDKDTDDFLKNKIIELTYQYIDTINKNNETFQEILEKIYSKFINKFTLDIVSCLIEYIKDEVFNKYLRKIFEMLEDNNILTTLIDIKSRKFKDIKVKDILEKYLNELTFNENSKFQCKFRYNFNLPGFYNFFVNIQKYINKNITSNYYNNEKILRELQVIDLDKKNTFGDNEESLLNNVFTEIVNNYKFYYEMLDKYSPLFNGDLILKDYITYYLKEYIDKYEIYNKEDIYHKTLELLLNLRFNEENIITKSGDKIKIFLIKIIWLESNIFYIKNIIKLIKNAKKIYQKDEDLYKKIQETIFDKGKIKIKYITNKKRNPEITKEVNQCYYIILACICYIVTSKEIQLIENYDDMNKNGVKVDIHDYIQILKEINNILQSINDELRVFLNEMYIIDELIKVYDLFKKNINIERINNIKNQMRENALIIQKYSDDDSKLGNELIDNFKIIYKLITDNEEVNKQDKSYYENLRYIYYKEIRKISLIDYRFEVIEKLLEENNIIKNSNEIFQLVLKDYLKKEDKFKENKKKILSGNDRIITLIESQINTKDILAETLLYLFEKNSINYYNILKSKSELKYLDEEPLDIFKDAISYLVDYSEKKENKEYKNKEFCKLFCLGYIKTFCFIFIKMFDAKEPKWKLPDNVINVLNGDNNVCKMIRLYIYKILYNEYYIDFFYKKDNIQKFKLEEYKDFASFIQNKELNNIYKIDYKIQTINNEKYEVSYKAIEKSKKDKFKNKITKIQFNIEDFGIDNFFIASYNSTLSYLQTESSEINENFYKNICRPLFEGKKTLLKALELFYEPHKLKEIKSRYKINSKNIKPFLFGYRYCVNILWNETAKGIYYSLYDGTNINYLREKLYPGNDAKSNQVFSDVINHFKNYPKEGCYVCLCAQGFYHRVPTGFPGKRYINKVCPKCDQNIGYQSGILSSGIVKRKDYFRIFKDENEIKALKKDENKKKKLDEINYMVLKDFKEKYIVKTNQNEKGIFKTDENGFKNDNKIIRNLSQVSYRLLNYILYMNLFFARIITEKNDFDNYLPDKMTWIKTITECFKLLEEELKKVNIISIDEFLHYIFAELFPILNKQKTIDNYKDLYKLEEILESKIQELIYKFILDGNSLEPLNIDEDNDKNSTINLLKENFAKEFYKDDEFPFYKYFYFTDYLNERHLKEKLTIFAAKKYPVLKTYLDFKIDNREEKNKNLLDNLHLFNNSLNIISQKYCYNVSREYAEKAKFQDEDIYKNNKILFDNFIKFYNNLDLKELQSKHSLNSSNSLADFFIEDTNEYGKSYKIIYKAFIQKQNEKLESLLDEKIAKDIFDNNCKDKKKIEEIKEEEIFTLNLPKKISFIEILFNYSHRNALNKYPIDYKAYKSYDINYDYIEEKMTELLLKNKKLLIDDNDTYITDFIYNNEEFNNKVSDSIATFNKRYTIKDLIIDDRVIIYKFCLGTINNFNLYKSMIKGFITLINILNNYRKEDINGENNKFKEDSKINDVIEELKDPTLSDLKKLFEQNDSLTVNKLSNIFDYYLRAIFECINSDIKKYQDKDLDKNKKTELDNYFKSEHIIKKNNFAYAIRLFISLVLFLEEDKDKEKKIKFNRNNIINYLKAVDFWETDLNEKILKNLDELKIKNFQVNQIISLYEILDKDIESNYFDDVNQKINAENNVDPSQNIIKEDIDDKPEENEQEENEQEEEENDPEDLY